VVFATIVVVTALTTAAVPGRSSCIFSIIVIELLLPLILPVSGALNQRHVAVTTCGWLTREITGRRHAARGAASKRKR
jgi:hypothetical protein